MPGFLSGWNTVTETKHPNIQGLLTTKYMQTFIGFNCDSSEWFINSEDSQSVTLNSAFQPFIGSQAAFAEEYKLPHNGFSYLLNI